jgi:ketosteroid isomerase-like protein
MGVSETPAASHLVDSLDKVCRFYETLTPDTLDALADVYADDARFVDPFNDVCGLPCIRVIFEDMFERTRQPRFEVLSRLSSGEQGFLTWNFHFGLGRQTLVVHGATHLRFAADGRVQIHRDYWDAAGELYARLPWIGPPMRWLRGRLAAPAPAEPSSRS